MLFSFFRDTSNRSVENGKSVFIAARRKLPSRRGGERGKLMLDFSSQKKKTMNALFHAIVACIEPPGASNRQRAPANFIGKCAVKFSQPENTTIESFSESERERESSDSTSLKTWLSYDFLITESLKLLARALSHETKLINEIFSRARMKSRKVHCTFASGRNEIWIRSQEVSLSLSSICR